jgi:hypothetical protein
LAEDGGSSGDGDDGELHCGAGKVWKVGWKSMKWVAMVICKWLLGVCSEAFWNC